MAQEERKLAVSRPVSQVRKDLILLGTLAFFMLILLGPLLAIGFTANPVANSGEGSTLRQSCYILTAGLILFALKPWENYRRIFAIPLPLMIGLGYCWLSLLWAIEPEIALRRLLLTTLIMWTVFAALRQLKFEEVVLLLRGTMLVILVLNYLAVFFMPEYGVHGGNQFDELSLAGDWRGLLQHKNLAGAACAFTLIIYSFDRGQMSRWLQIAVMAAAAYFLYRTNSKTSFGLALGALAVGFVFLRYNQRYRSAVMILLCIVAIVATVMEGMYQNPLLGRLDDPKAFTGRTQIWNALIHYIGDNPFLGSGYGSFWDIGPKSPIFSYAVGEFAKMPNGHNGFLDITAQLGLPGLVLILAVAVIYPLHKLLVSPLAVGQRGAMLIGLFLFCIGHNATESTLFDRDMLVWVMLMISMALSQPDLIIYQRAKFDVHRLLRFGPSPSAPSGNPVVTEATTITRRKRSSR